MAGTDPSLVVRVAATIDQIKADLADLKGHIADLADKANTASNSLFDAFQHPGEAVLDLAKKLGGALVESIGAANLAILGLGAALAGALVLGAKELYDLGMAATAFGESIYDASLKISASVPAVSDLRYAAIAAGGSLDQMANLVFMMQQRLEMQPVKFQKALDDLHISAKAFIDLAPDQRILAVSDAMRAAGETTNLQAVAMELFGRSGKEALTVLLKPLEELTQHSKDLGYTLTEEDAKAAEELGIKTRQLALDWEHFKVSIGEDVIPILSALVDAFHKVKGVASDLVPYTMLGATWNMVTGAWHYANEAAHALVGSVVELPTVAGPATDSMKRMAAATTDHQKAVDALMPGQHELARIIADSNKDIEESIKAHKKWQEAMDELAVSGDGWKGTLDGIDGSVVEAAKAYLEAGVSARALGEVYDLNTTQLKALELAVKADAKALREHQIDAEKAAKIEAAGLLEVTKLWNEHDELVTKATGTTLDGQIAAVDKWAEDLEAKMQEAGTDTQQFYEALTAVWTQKLNGLMVDEAALTKTASTDSQAGLQQIADRAAATAAEAMTHVGEWRDSTIQAYRDTATAAQLAADNFGQAFGTTFDKVAAKAQATTASIGAAWNDVTRTITTAMAAAAKAAGDPAAGGTKDPYEMVRALPYGDGTRNMGIQSASYRSFAGGSGGYQDFGSGTMAMLHGREKVVAAGTEEGGGVTNHITINVTQPLGTPTAIAAVIDEAFTKRLRATGFRFPNSASQ